AVLLGLAFRSFFVGLISILPGLFPVMATGALLWFLGGGLEFASVVALIVIFGLGIDALVHFLNRLRLEEQKGDGPEKRVRRARERDPPCARAGWTGDHSHDDGAGLRARGDRLLRLAVAQNIRARLRRHSARLPYCRSRIPARDNIALSALRLEGWRRERGG